MRKRSLLTILAMLSILLVGTGTAYAIYGTDDFVPANTVIVPIICAVAGGPNDLNTNIAVAETGIAGDASTLTGCYSPLSDPPVVTPDGLAVIGMHAEIFNSCSVSVDDFDDWFTCYDVETYNCKAIVANMSQAQKNLMLITVAGAQYYAGYITFNVSTMMSNNLLAWVYLQDLNLGYISGFNGIPIEGAFGARMEENAGNGPITAHTIYGRYFLLNDAPSTLNWWFVLLGRNQIGRAVCTGQDGTPVDVVNCADAAGARNLSGIFCNEQEVCHSLDIPIPRELNIIDIEAVLPGSVQAGGFPKAGIGKFTISETGNQSGTAYSITGTCDPNACGLIGGHCYTAVGGSYQRGEGSSVQASWDAWHPLHRDYCNEAEGMSYITGPDCTAKR